MRSLHLGRIVPGFRLASISLGAHNFDSIFRIKKPCHSDTPNSSYSLFFTINTCDLYAKESFYKIHLNGVF